MALDNTALEQKRDNLRNEIVQLRNQLNDKENLFARFDKIVQKKQTVQDPEDPEAAKETLSPIIDEGTGSEMAETRRQEIYDELVKAHPELAD